MANRASISHFAWVYLRRVKWDLKVDDFDVLDRTPTVVDVVEDLAY